MKTIPWRLLAGGMLLILGGLLLLQTMGVLPTHGDPVSLLFSILFIGGGAVFWMVLFMNSRQNWWAVIPGCVLIGLGLLIFGDIYFPVITAWIGGGIFLGSIAVAFWLVYFMNRDRNWWALIPGGVLTTLALIAVDPISRLIPAEFLFFIGLSGTFALVALIAHPREKFTWAWIPSGVLMAIAVIIGFTTTRMKLAFPIVLILAGFIVLAAPYVAKLRKGDKYD